MDHARTHVVIPTDLLREIDALVGRRGRSAFITEVTAEAVKRRKLRSILERRDPIWKTEDHPELKRGAAAWVSKVRTTEERSRKRK
ncbi:MAG TPA: hypothetical protein VNX18_22285 [Bryobacteraceae bacterium]|jgi:hypothetical protein|nr:hypothetical protein [Bryobacteraceae bacterium]